MSDDSRAMNDYILFMHDDVPGTPSEHDEAWTSYLSTLRASGAFDGGSSIGDGICMSKASGAPGITRHVAGYLRVRAESMDAARELVAGNPVYESGGIVEIRELPNTG